MDFDEIFSKCPKWNEEQVIGFWDRSESLFGSSESRLPACVCEQDNAKAYGQILMKFQDMSENVKGRND